MREYINMEQLLLGGVEYVWTLYNNGLYGRVVDQVSDE